MQKLSYDEDFYTFILRKICDLGGTRMLLPISDLTKEMQKLDPLDSINLHRKQYGNIDQALKALKIQFFIIDNSIIKLKSYEKIEELYNQKFISPENFNYFQKQYEINEKKNIETMKINKQNKCSKCGEIYKEIINKQGECQADGQSHESIYNFN